MWCGCKGVGRNTLTKFKKLLLQNHWANFSQTWYNASLGEGDSSFFKCVERCGPRASCLFILWLSVDMQIHTCIWVFWQEVIVKSPILSWPLRPVVLLVFFFLDKLYIHSVVPLRINHLCTLMFVWCFTSHLRTFHSYGDTGEGLQFLAHWSWKLNHLLSVICLSLCLSVHWSVWKLFTFLTSSLEPLGQFQPNLAQRILGWRGFKFIQMKGHTLLQGEIIAYLKIIFSRTAEQISTNSPEQLG